MQFSFLERLTLQLLAGAVSLPETIRQPAVDYVLTRQRPDGGWGGREGGSDLYYTGFALRTLAVCGRLEGDVAERAAAFLKGSLGSSQGVVDLISLLYGGQLIVAACDIDPFAGFGSRWVDRVIAFFESLRRPDGGFAKSPDSIPSSTYQGFLIALSRQLLERPLGSDDPLGDFLISQRRPDGGFVEVSVAVRSGTNPTAAAVVALSTLQRLDDETRSEAIAFLNAQITDGGFTANTRIPVPDLLSSFTALTALWELEALEPRHRPIAALAQSLQRSNGGFGGFALDPADDIEYTFYGLGTLALLEGFAEG